MPVKMIVTDLDRTLLRTDKTISGYTAEALNRCREKGIKIVFATARSEKSAERMTKMFCPDIIVSNGGALASQNGRLLYRQALSIVTANRLLRRCMDAPGVGYITADTEKGYFVNYPIDPNDSGWLDYTHAQRTDFSDGFDGEVFKITAEIEGENVAVAIKEGLDDVNLLRFSGENWYRYAHKNAVKWNAVQTAAKRLGISARDIAAFGDDYNDIEMLRECGVGVAVENALDEAKAAADFVCGSNDSDGVAKWLEENVL